MYCIQCINTNKNNWITIQLNFQKCHISQKITKYINNNWEFNLTLKLCTHEKLKKNTKNIHLMHLY